MHVKEEIILGRDLSRSQPPGRLQTTTKVYFNYQIRFWNLSSQLVLASFLSNFIRRDRWIVNLLGRDLSRSQPPGRLQTTTKDKLLLNRI